MQNAHKADHEKATKQFNSRLSHLEVEQMKRKRAFRAAERQKEMEHARKLEEIKWKDQAQELKAHLDARFLQLKEHQAELERQWMKKITDKENEVRH